jgi:translation initiation factor IF-2
MAQVRQSFSHGRSKTVTVEVKKKRLILPKDQKETPASKTTEEQNSKDLEKKIESESKKASTSEAIQLDAQGLTSQEMETRIQILRDQASQEQAKEPTSDDAELFKKNVEFTDAEPEKTSKVAKPKKAEKEKREEISPEAESPEIEAPLAVKEHKEASKKHSDKKAEEDDDGESRRKRADARHGVLSTRRQTKKVDISVLEAGEEDEEEAKVSKEPVVAPLRPTLRPKPKVKQEYKKIVYEVELPETIPVQELASRMAVRATEVIKALMKMGSMVTINQSIDVDTAEIIVEEFGHTSKRVSSMDVEDSLKSEEDPENSLKPRAPVVTVMGHVDHGKTSLLDALRKTDVVKGEAGGITQHIGAYQITLKSGEKITFIDTPGHAAFTEMRARGANVTDLVILVVAADDGIKEQTIEAINHAKAAEVPIIVAINKMDRPEANPDKVRQELLSHEIVVEGMGGEVLDVEISAKENKNLDKLTEMICLQSEMLDLKANPDRPGEGVVIEAKLERGRGTVATVLVQRGTLCIGDVLVVGSEYGRVRALVNDHDQNIKEAGPSVPVEVLGLGGAPLAGDQFNVVESEARAREVADFRAHTKKEAQSAASVVSLEQMFEQIQQGEKKELPILIKADVQGSLEAIRTSLEKLSTEEVAVKIIFGGVGGISESDVILAQASGAVIVGFDVRANAQAREIVQKEKLDIRYYSVIYDLIEDVKGVLGGLLSPIKRETFLGNAEVREVFNITKVGKIGGCYVTEGMVKRGGKVRLLRDSVVIHEGTLKTLKRFKDEVKEVKEGYECGMAFENYYDIRVGDIIECFEIEEIARTL